MLKAFIWMIGYLNGIRSKKKKNLLLMQEMHYFFPIIHRIKYKFNVSCFLAKGNQN